MSALLSRRDSIAAAALLLSGCGAPRSRALTAQEMPPPALREFRGAWVATVANIDWPSAPGLPMAQQQAEVQTIVERASALGLNALIVQVRPACDAIYSSALEPASETLSGTQGVAPGYDALAFWIDAAHARGIALHAWFNPFRARHPSAKTPLAANHIARRQPGWAKAYGDGLWLDPGEPGAAAHTLQVIEDVVSRYDIDGVHIDDYFYPYPVAAAQGGELAFPDAASYARSHSPLARDDWRRDNIDRFVRTLYERVHAIRPQALLGISPFGLPRAASRVGPSAGIEGFDAHAKLYADAERWLAEGWIDYAAPQLYWQMAPREQAFAVLLDHWAATNTKARHLWPGLFTSRVALAPKPWPADEIERQLAHLRAHASQAGGYIHFSMVALLDDRGGLASRLLMSANGPALVPASPWLVASVLPPPVLNEEPHAIVITVADNVAPPRWLALWQRRAAAWRFSVHDARAPLRVPLDGLEAVAASSVHMSGVESERVSLRLFGP